MAISVDDVIETLPTSSPHGAAPFSLEYDAPSGGVCKSRLLLVFETGNAIKSWAVVGRSARFCCSLRNSPSPCAKAHLSPKGHSVPFTKYWHMDVLNLDGFTSPLRCLAERGIPVVAVLSKFSQ